MVLVFVDDLECVNRPWPSGNHRSDGWFHHGRASSSASVVRTFPTRDVRRPDRGSVSFVYHPAVACYLLVVALVLASTGTTRWQAATQLAALCRSRVVRSSSYLHVNYSVVIDHLAVYAHAERAALISLPLVRLACWYQPSTTLHFSCFLLY